MPRTRAVTTVHSASAQLIRIHNKRMVEIRPRASQSTLLLLRGVHRRSFMIHLPGFRTSQSSSTLDRSSRYNEHGSTDQTFAPPLAADYSCINTGRAPKEPRKGAASHAAPAPTAALTRLQCRTSFSIFHIFSVCRAQAQNAHNNIISVPRTCSVTYHCQV